MTLKSGRHPRRSARRPRRRPIGLNRTTVGNAESQRTISNWYSLPSSNESTALNAALFHRLAGHPAIFGKARAKARSDRYIGTCTRPSSLASNDSTKGSTRLNNASWISLILSNTPGRTDCTQYGAPHGVTPSPNGRRSAVPPVWDRMVLRHEQAKNHTQIGLAQTKHATPRLHLDARENHDLQNPFSSRDPGGPEAIPENNGQPLILHARAAKERCVLTTSVKFG